MKLNKTVFLGLVIYPTILVMFALYYTVYYGLGFREIILLTLGHYITNITVGVGLHRMWSHGAFKTNKVIEFILVLLSAGAFQGPVLAWVSDHYRHHTYTDQELDPHSPSKYKNNKFKGFLWAHMGWMLFSTPIKSLNKAVIHKLGRNKLLIWQLKYYWYLVFFMHVIAPLMIGYLFLGQTIQGMSAAWIFINLGRAFQQQMTFCINSVCHLYGSKKYSPGTEGDIIWLAPLLLGENWHNFHHAFPKDYRNGVKWYHFDVHKWIIFLMEKLHCAWDVNRTPETRIEAKATETAQIRAYTKTQWNGITEKCENLKIKIKNKLHELENSPLAINTLENLQELYKNIGIIIDKAKTFSIAPEYSSEMSLKIYQEQLNKIEEFLLQIYGSQEG